MNQFIVKEKQQLAEQVEILESRLEENKNKNKNYSS